MRPTTAATGSATPADTPDAHADSHPDAGPVAHAAQRQPVTEPVQAVAVEHVRVPGLVLPPAVVLDRVADSEPADVPGPYDVALGRAAVGDQDAVITGRGRQPVQVASRMPAACRRASSR